MASVPRVNLRTLFQGSLILFPYTAFWGYFGLLIGLFLLLVRTLRTRQAPIYPAYVPQFLAGVAALMLLSSWVAYDRPEALTQLGNFWPFFLFFLAILEVFRTLQHWHQAALGLVLTSLPLNLISLVEYGLKSPRLPLDWQQIPWIATLRMAPHKGRAMVFFNHPNTFASYLVLLLGLGLGLLLYQWAHRPPQTPPSHPLTLWLGLSTFACLVGIFASGSRNGLLVAVSQVGLFILCSPFSRTLVLGGVGGLLALLGGALVFGIGGRSLSPSSWLDDPRIGVWRVAWDLIQERPWLGWGLGNYKLVFPPRTFDPVAYANVYHPHNIVLLLAAETGVLVLALALLGVGVCCYRALRVWLTMPRSSAEKSVLLGYLLAFWGCVAYSMLDLTFYDGHINALNWFLLAGLFWFGKDPGRFSARSPTGDAGDDAPGEGDRPSPPPAQPSA